MRFITFAGGGVGGAQVIKQMFLAEEQKKGFFSFFIGHKVLFYFNLSVIEHG
jgi:hypothetical protein